MKFIWHETGEVVELPFGSAICGLVKNNKRPDVCEISIEEFQNYTGYRNEYIARIKNSLYCGHPIIGTYSSRTGRIHFCSVEKIQGLRPTSIIIDDVPQQ